MDSTKSLNLIARTLTVLSLVFISLGSSAPVVSSDNEASICSFDVSITYSNEVSITSELPSSLKDILSSNGFENVEVAESMRHKSVMRDIVFHAHHDQHEDETEFHAFLRVKTTAHPCPSFPAAILTTAELAALLKVDSVLSFVAIPSAAAKSDETVSAHKTVTGTANLVISDFSDGSSDKYAEITTDAGEVFTVGGPDSDDAVKLSEWQSLRTGDNVELLVEHTTIGPEEHVAVGRGFGLAYRHAAPRHRLVAVTRRTAKPTDKSAPTGVGKLIAIRIKYTDVDPDAICTADCLDSNIWSGQYNVDGVYREASNGAMSFPKASGMIITVSLNVASTSYSSCSDLASISAAADAAVASQFPSVVLSSFSTKVYITPSICGIGIAYLGSTPGKAFVHSSYPDTIAHEVGHTLGMQHSNRDPGDDNNVDEYYGDRSCIMGYSQVSLRSFNVVHRIENGWVPSSAILDLADGCTGVPQTVTLAPLSHANVAGSLVAVRAIRRTLGRYFLSFRNGDGYDGLQTATYINKVALNYQIAEGAQVQVIAMLSVGQTWTQANGDLSVTVTAIDTTVGATLSISYCRPSTLVGVAGVLTCGSTITGTNVGAANLGGYTSGDVLYAVSLQAGVSYTFSTCGSALDTVVRVYNDAMYEQLSFCDNCGTCASNENNAVLAGFTGSGNHIVSVEGFNTAAGSFVLSLQCSGTPTTTQTVATSPSPAPSSSPAPSPSSAAPTPSVSRSPSASRAPSRSASVSVTRSRMPSVSATPSKAPKCGTLAAGKKCSVYTQCSSCTCSAGKCK